MQKSKISEPEDKPIEIIKSPDLLKPREKQRDLKKKIENFSKLWEHLNGLTHVT
jgi:hypothetical protein